MLKKRIIPCLDVANGRVVKGKQFQGLEDVASPEELADYYVQSGADELVFYDITASKEGRQTDLNFVRAVADRINIPFCVGGGISQVDDFDRILKSGADKVSINSAAVLNPNIINKAARLYGNQCVVVSMDVKRWENDFQVLIHGGITITKLTAVEWAKEAARRGAGELVINSIDEDGMRGGYDLELLKAITNCVNIPVIASGGAGQIEHFRMALQEAGVDGVLAASVFHQGEIKIRELKAYLDRFQIPVRTYNED